MKYIISLSLFLLLYGCFGKSDILPESELKTLSVTKVMELGAEMYQADKYDAAAYYYEYVRKNFTNDLENFAWATYEIGFIKYQQGKYKESLNYFDEVISLNVSDNAPLILASKMREKVQRILSKSKK